MDKYTELAELIFPEITETVEDLEKRYPERNLPEGAMVTRFAPSPTGFLHTGSLFTSMVTYKAAKQSGGVFYTRLEDTDQKREIKDSGIGLIEQLKVFGIVPDEGYMGDHEEGNYGPYVQSQRADIYKVVIKDMIKRNLAYPCFATPEELTKMREEQAANKENFGYYGKYAKYSFLTPEEAMEKIKAGEEYVIRFRSSGDYHNKVVLEDGIRGHIEIAENDQHIVILKSDGLPTYHFAHLCDDHFMRTTHVTRGEEWLPSVPIHLELFKAMGWQAPKYCHLPVIMKLDNGTRRKLSKRKDNEAATSFFLEKGYPVAGFMEYLMTIANSDFEMWRDEHKDAPLSDFKFTFDKMSLDGALFDLDKVENLCKEYLGNLSTDEMFELSYNYAKEYDAKLLDLIERDKDYFKKILSIERGIEKPRKDYEKLGDIYELVKFFYEPEYSEMIKDVDFTIFNQDNLKEALTEYVKVLDLSKTEEEWFNDLKELALSLNYAKNPKTYKKDPDAYKGSVADFAAMIRLVVTLRPSSPNMYIVMTILGQDEVTRRINEFIK